MNTFKQKREKSEKRDINLEKDLKKVFRKYKVNTQDSRILAKAFYNFDESCFCLKSQWFSAEMYCNFLHKNKAPKIIKDLYEWLKKKQSVPYNYNDLDSDLWAEKLPIEKECLYCDAYKYNFIYLKEGETVISQKDCKKCKGTGKRNPDYAYSILHQDHGRWNVFFLIENCLGYDLHIRRLDYNMKKQKALEIYKEMNKAIVLGRYDSNNEYLRYHDIRDKGFVFGMTFNKGNKKYGYSDRFSNNDFGDLYSHHALQTLVAHFPAIITDED